jgi:peptide subunit release factor 1 (eRF1)
MIELDGTLSELARLRSGSEPIVSLYLDIRWKDEQQRDRVRLFVQERIRQTLANYRPGTPGREELERTLRRIQDHVSGLLAQEYEADKNGLALFANESLGMWRPFFFRRSFVNALTTDAIPHLTQLTRLADDYAPAIVVTPGQAGADIYHVSLGDLHIEANLRGFVPRREKENFNAGTSGHSGRYYERETKDDRHTENFIQKNRRAAAAEVTAFYDQNPKCFVVLVGTAETLAAFERELPERIRERVIARLPRPRGWESGDGMRRDGVVEGAGKAIAEREKEDEHRAIDGVVGEALRGGLGVLGPSDVVEALNQRRVHKLVIEECFDGTGWRCDNCLAIGSNVESAESCPYCGGELRAVGDLGEAIVARALLDGADVEVVAHANKLHSYRGVGAFLRQTSQNGLRGANLAYPTAPGVTR